MDMKEGQRPRVLCVTPAIYPPFVINVQQPMEILRKKGLLSYVTRLEKHLTAADINECGLVLFFRVSAPALLKYLQYSKAAGKPVVYGTDDNFFELASSGKGPMDPLCLDALSRFMRLSDAVLVYSCPMAERAGSLNKNVVKLDAGINLSVLDGVDRKAHDGKVRMVYATSRYSNDILWEIFLPAVKRALLEYEGRLEMEFWGFLPGPASGLPGVNFVPAMDYETYLKRLYAQGFDIGLAPLKDDLFHRSKTNTKLRDYGACMVAGIYSNVDVYSDCVKDGVTGVLVDNTEEAWYGAIKRLVEDKGLRDTIKLSASEFVRKNYGMEMAAEQLYGVIGPLAAATGVPQSKGILKRFVDIETPDGGEITFRYSAKRVRAYLSDTRRKASRFLKRILKPLRQLYAQIIFIILNL